jgi:hypothetical protein
LSDPARFHKLLDELTTSVEGRAFTRLAAEAPIVLSAWHAPHIALGWLHIDPKRAQAELETLYALNCTDSGQLLAERAFTTEAAEARAQEVGEIFDEQGRSVLIAPPVAAYAAARVASVIGEPARGLLESASAHLDAIWGERLPPDTPLPVILHPLEAGTHGSPLFDELIDAADMFEWLDDAGTLIRSAVACKLDPDRALRAGHPFVVEDPVFCGWFLLALEELQRAWERLGGADAQTTKLRIRIDMIARGIIERLWWDGEEIFAAVDRARGKPLRALTLGGLLPAASKSVIEDGEAKQAIERHLRPGVTPLWGTHGVSFNPIARDVPLDPAQVLWRGNAMSPLTHYVAHLALVGARRPADARAARVQLEDLIEIAGIREFYDASTREGYGAGSSLGYAGTAVLLEMQAREEA